MFLTHLHYDHLIDVPALVLRRWDQGAGRIEELRVFDPPPARRIFDLLFADEGVFDPVLKARTLNQASVGTLVLTHLTEQVDTDGTRERVLKDVGEIFEGRVILGQDLQVLTPRPAATGDPL